MFCVRQVNVVDTLSVYITSDVVDTLYGDVLNLQNAVRCYDTHVEVMPFMPLGNVCVCGCVVCVCVWCVCVCVCVCGVCGCVVFVGVCVCGCVCVWYTAPDRQARSTRLQLDLILHLIVHFAAVLFLQYSFSIEISLPK